MDLPSYFQIITVDSHHTICFSSPIKINLSFTIFSFRRALKINSRRKFLKCTGTPLEKLYSVCQFVVANAFFVLIIGQIYFSGPNLQALQRNKKEVRSIPRLGFNVAAKGYSWRKL